MRGIFLVRIAGGLWGTVGIANGLMTGRAALDPLVVRLERTAIGAVSLPVAAAGRDPSEGAGRDISIFGPVGRGDPRAGTLRPVSARFRPSGTGRDAGEA